MKKVIFRILLFVVLSSSLTDGFSQIITTFAGNASPGHSGDGGPASAASIHNPTGCAFDSFGNFFFVEFDTHCIRKVDNSGVISTLAGTTIAGYNGDGIAATNAQLNFPNSVVCDKAGNLYISDGNNCRVRKVDRLTGLISTVAGNGVAGFSGDGGSATNAQLKYPGGICFDFDGNLLISDPNNRRLRKLRMATSTISTIAGNGLSGSNGDGGPATDAQLTPGALCVDKVGNIYAADYSLGHSRIVQINYSTGIIETFAGTDTGYKYNGDGMLATSTNVSPSGLAFDYQGNLFFADGYNDRIRKVSTDGLIYNVAGTGIGGYGGDGSLALSAQLDQPYGITFDTCGNLYIAEVNNHRIRKVAFNPDCLPISVQDVKGNEHISVTIHPNPATETLTITAGVEIETITILNAIGQVVTSPRPSLQTKVGTGKEREVLLDISHLPRGVYMVRVNEAWTGKFVKE